ncbi:MAG: hypothetical protein KF861_09865 [Planctomycetaceae bacterium]|nr:hypothetical protein [Planctomycetaceae bacterium]
MNDSHPDKLEAVDHLVARYLHRQAEQIDATRLAARVRAQWLSSTTEPQMSTPPTKERSPAPSRRWAQRAAWAVATTLLLFAGFIGGRHLASSSASAAVILRDVHSAHLQDVDRCYRVQFAPDPKYWDGKNQFKGPSESVLWTRGDRFWADVQIAKIRLLIGRDEEGTLWASPSPSKGIRFTDRLSDLPEEVEFACRVNSMSLPALVEDVLADFDLRSHGPSSHAGAATNLVWANLKPGRSHRLLSTALLEIDARSDVIMRLVLWTIDEGEPKGTITFTLIDSDTIGDAQYRLEAHVDAGATIERHDLTRPTPASPPAASPTNGKL